MRARPFALVVPAILAGCGAHSAIPVDPSCGSGDTTADVPTCVAANDDDPCGPLHLVAPVCNPSTRTLRCPERAWPYARAAEAPDTCLPFSDLFVSGQSLQGWGVGGSPVPVPTDDGRCLWVVDTIQMEMGGTIPNVAFEIDRTAPFGTCPTAASFAGGAPASVVQIEGGEYPDVRVQIASAFRFAGETRVAYRLFKDDPYAVYGVVDLGGGLGRWDPTTQRIVVQGPSAIAFPTTLDLGTASLVQPDHAYLWGCPKADDLINECIVTRLDPQGTMELFTGNGSWTTTLDGSLGATTILSGPWVSSVVAKPGSGGLLHVYAGGFGTTLETQVAPAPEGPWAAAAPLGGCQLPGADAGAYCAGPVVHPELADPTRPGEVVVSYAVGSTSPDQDTLKAADPKGYWGRLVWATAP